VARSRTPRRTRPVTQRIGAGPAVALTLVVLVLYVPLARLVWNSLNADPVGRRWGGFTDRWFAEVRDDPVVRAALWRSVRLAVAASLGAVVLGVGLVVALPQVRRGAARVASTLAGARVATPELVMATGLAVLVPLVGWRFGFRAMLLGHVVYLSAYVVLVVGARAARRDRSFEEAAADLGARPWRVVRTVTLPDLAPAIWASLLLTAAFSFDDVVMSQRLAGPRDATLPMVILSVAQRRVTPALDAIGVLVIIAGAVTFAAALMAGRGLRTITAGQDRTTTVRRA
jgi:putrescine transport system permease protein